MKSNDSLEVESRTHLKTRNKFKDKEFSDLWIFDL